MVLKLPRLLDIFSELICTKALCIQILASSQPQQASVWAISFSWCGKTRSMPPPWMSRGR